MWQKEKKNISRRSFSTYFCSAILVSLTRARAFRLLPLVPHIHQHSVMYLTGDLGLGVCLNFDQNFR
jgi:hypothetical protein